MTRLHLRIPSQSPRPERLSSAPPGGRRLWAEKRRFSECARLAETGALGAPKRTGGRPAWRTWTAQPREKRVSGFGWIPRHARDPDPVPSAPHGGRHGARTLRGSRQRNEHARARRLHAAPRTPPRAHALQGARPRQPALELATPREQGNLARCNHAGPASRISALTSSARRRRGRTFPRVTPSRAGRGGRCGAGLPPGSLGAPGPGRSHLRAAAANGRLAQ